MADECRVVIINEETEELMKNELIDDDLTDQIVGIIDDGYVETFEECADVCNVVSEMLKEAGVETEDHDAMIEVLKGLKLVRKEGNGNGGNGKKKKVVKKNGE